MGLKTDLIDAKIEGLRGSGATDEAILQAQEVLEVQTQLEVEAIVTFLENAKFRITNLAANVVLEDFKIPPQQGDIQPTVTSTDIPFPGGVSSPPIQVPLNNGINGVLTKDIDVGTDGGTTGILKSTGYAFIGGNPDSQDAFDVSDEGGQKDFTEVRFFRDDNEGELG